MVGLEPNIIGIVCYSLRLWLFYTQMSCCCCVSNVLIPSIASQRNVNKLLRTYTLFFYKEPVYKVPTRRRPKCLKNLYY